MLLIETSEKKYYNVTYESDITSIKYNLVDNTFLLIFKWNHKQQLVRTKNFRIFGYVPSTKEDKRRYIKK